MNRKRLSAFFLAVVFALSLAVPAYAAQSRAANFLKTYELTGDGAADMVAIAQSQLYRRGMNFDYTEQWCADFVSDCARLAGQSRAVPFHNNVYGLRDQILEAGGIISTYNPQPGDICFMDWEGDNNWDHVEIVYMVSAGAVYTIGGNTGVGTTPQTRRVDKHAPIPRSQIAMILRPAYSGGEEVEEITTIEEIQVDESYYDYNPVHIPTQEVNIAIRLYSPYYVHLLN